MGWVWRDDEDDYGAKSNGGDEFTNPNPNSNPTATDRCATRRIVSTNCNTEEIEPGKFIRKCEKTEQILRDCVGKPTEIVQSNKEYTEEDVTDEVMKGSSSIMGSSESSLGPFDFPGLRSDIEGIERSFFGGINRFFEAADEMRNGFFRMLDDPSVFGGHSSSSSRRREIPIDGHSSTKKTPETDPYKLDSGSLDIPALAKDV